MGPLIEVNLWMASRCWSPNFGGGNSGFHRRYGKLPLQTVIDPAIKMAESGLPVYPELKRAHNFWGRR